MIVQTDFVRPTGQGTPMFSKIGGLTSFQHRVFAEDRFDSHSNKIALPIADEFIGKNEYLPQILNQAQRQFQLDQIIKRQEEEKALKDEELRAEEEAEAANPESSKKKKKGSSYSFNAVTRNHAVVQRHYYGNRETPAPAHYRPNFTSIEPKDKSVRFHHADPVIPRDKIHRSPNCIQGELPCGIEVRKAIRLGATTQMASIPVKLDNEKDEFYDTEKIKVIEKLDYYSQHIGLLNIPFQKQLDRKGDVLLMNPIPHDKRFEAVLSNLSVLSTHSNNIVPQIDKYSERGHLFPPKPIQPDYNTSNEVVKTDLKLGVPNFLRYTTRKPNDNVRPYQMPDGYDSIRIEQGISAISDYKKAKGLVQFEKVYPRDNSMYKYDDETLRLMKKQLNRKDFSYNEYLPHSIKSYYTSRNSLASTAQSVLNQTKSGIRSRKSSINNIDLDSVHQVDGSFLCLDKSKKKLIDISRVKGTTRELITGEKSFTTESRFL